MSNPSVAAFKKYFEKMEHASAADLPLIYARDVHFQDPLHEIQGLERLAAYFEKLNENLASGGFVFKDEGSTDRKTFLSWNLELKLKRPAKVVRASGFSVLTLDGNNKAGGITVQRDYFDAGELFYENIPLLGGIIRKLKKKLAG